MITPDPLGRWYTSPVHARFCQLIKFPQTDKNKINLLPCYTGTFPFVFVGTYSVVATPEVRKRTTPAPGPDNPVAYSNLGTKSTECNVYYGNTPLSYFHKSSQLRRPMRMSNYPWKPHLPTVVRRTSGPTDPCL
jgi:hypothetical protein